MSSRLHSLGVIHPISTTIASRSLSTTSTIRSSASPTKSLLDDITGSFARKPSRPQPTRIKPDPQTTDGFMARIMAKPAPLQRPSQSAPRRGAEEALDMARLQEMQKTVRRQWKSGDVYAPHDLTGAEARKWRQTITPAVDMFDQLAINPLDEWKNPSMMYEFQTTQGKILKRANTGLRPVNQRRVARAIRRAIGMGFLPSVHAHPELLRRTNRGVGV